jgi:hypothetical protein
MAPIEASSLPRANLDVALELLGEGGGVRVLSVNGSSMVPTLADGDGIAVDLGATVPRPGDLALFRQADGLVVHRFLRAVTRSRHGAHLRFRGDGRPSFDPPVASGDVRGIVRAVRRGEAWWSLEGPAARAWARALAWHGRFWGFKFAVAHRIFGSRAPRTAMPWPVRWVARVDRMALRALDRALFRALHRRVSEPPQG